LLLGIFILFDGKDFFLPRNKQFYFKDAFMLKEDPPSVFCLIIYVRTFLREMFLREMVLGYIPLLE